MEAGTVLQNRYLIENPVGQGGMGTVYIATDRRFGTRVAIKETLFTDQNLRRAFEREAQLLNSLRHPALPRVSDYFEESSGMFIVMEYIAGADLSEILFKNGAFAAQDVLKWTDQLLDALEYLHSQKTPVIHRDIKPQNLKLTQRGDIVLLDFGLAKGSASELSQLSGVKSVFGYSRAYAPLEQIQGAGTDPRSDLYSLAATVYHLLTGKPPVDALARATAVLSGDADPLVPAHRLNPKISAPIAEVLQQAMALNHKARPANAAKMRFAVTEAAEKPFEAHAAVRSENFGIAADVFTQNTELMSEAGKTAVRSTGETGVINSATTPEPEHPKTTQEEEPTKVRPVAAANGNERQRASNNLPPARRRSPVVPLGVAALIVLLGGLGLAFFRGGLTASSENEAGAARQNLQPAGNFSVTVAPSANNVPANQAVVEANARTETAQTDSANDAPAETGNDAAPATTAHEAGKTAKNKEKQIANNQNSSGSKTQAADNRRETDGDWTDLDKLEEKIEAEVKRVEVHGNNLENIPPEIRSNDPRRPIDPQKLKIYIKKQQDQATRRLSEINRRRREKGLPPVAAPSPKVVVVSPPKKPENSNLQNEQP